MQLRIVQHSQTLQRGRHLEGQATRALWWLILLACLLSMLVIAAHPQPAVSGWPRTIRSDSIKVDVYQPQVDKWENGKLEARAALAVTERASNQTHYGSVWLSGKTALDQDKRQVTLYDIETKKATFPSAGAQEPAYVTEVKEALQQWNMTISLDRLLADIAITQNEEKSTGDVFNSTPPKIFVRENPAVLILIDGQPLLQKIPETKFLRVTNSPAMIVLDSDSGRYFLRGDAYWMTAASIQGPWSKATDAPASLSALLEASEQPIETASQVTPPEVIVSTEPAELIQIKGEPQFSAIDGTRLLYVTNTDSDLFMSLPQQSYYALLSGRWFHAPGLEGPWEFAAGTSLPADFSRIPGGHPKSAVLASVPGTPEAHDAVVAAQVPQTATVDRRKTTFTATYDGEPKFKQIPGTDMSYGVNSPSDVIKARGKYYAVSNGVWFVADDPLGPWAVCDFVPPEIYTIPPTVPVYHVKYVYVYDATPDLVYVGYTPGYFGALVWDGVVVYGTGFYYPCWCGSSYFGWPWTWGFGFRYGYWGGGFFWRPWYPRPWYWHHWRFEHAPPVWWNRVVYNRSIERTRTQVNFQHATVYDRWKPEAVINRRAVPLRAPGRIAVHPEVIVPKAGTPRRDLYSGRDGQVYSRQNHDWYRHSGQNWEKVQPRISVPSAPEQPTTKTPAAGQHRFEELERNHQARIQGQNRVNEYRAMPPSARSTSPTPRMSAPSMPAPAPHVSAPHGGGRRP